MNAQATSTDAIRPKLRAWNDFGHRDRYQHIVSDDEHAADLLGEALGDDIIDPRHPYALCGVSLVILNGTEADLSDDFWERNLCPECAEFAGIG